MTKKTVFKHLIQQARTNGFEFKQWYQARIQAAWPGLDEAIEVLAHERRYYGLLFSHEFARSFWSNGSQISFLVPASNYVRRDKDGEMVTVQRKAFTRRTLKPDVWRYHLREMAAADDPVMYIRKFLVTQEDIDGYDGTRKPLTPPVWA